MVTWPSAMSTALLSLRTNSTVVPCICALLSRFRIPPLYCIPTNGSRHRIFGPAGEKKRPDWRPARCSSNWGLRETIAVIVLMHCCHRMISFAAAFYLPSTVAARGGYRPGFAAARSILFAGVLSGRLAHGRAAPAYGQQILAEHRCRVVPRQSSSPRRRWFSDAPTHRG